MHPDHNSYYRFTGRARLEKSVNSLLGIVEGITADSKLTRGELGFIRNWLSEHDELAIYHPYNELIPVLATALADGVLTSDEKEDIRWLCLKLRSEEYFDRVTADIQRLHGVVGAIAADGIITVEELRGLSSWLEENDHLKTCWPYDEVSSLVTNVLADGKIDDEEHQVIHRFFSEFIALFDERTIVSPPFVDGTSLVGLTAVCPDISFSGSTFCFTGTSEKYTKSQLSDMALSSGAQVANSVTKKLNYLVIGANGNPCWAYACYGRKVEKAVELRKQGARIVIVHENDFHDAIAELR